MTEQLTIKVCGMRDIQNIADVARSGTNLMGFIFYPKSKRYVGQDFDPKFVQQVKPNIKTVGVFVNEDLETVAETAKKYSLDYIQLHGNESPGYCETLCKAGLKIIKAFGVSDSFQFGQVEPYQHCTELFLFDTQDVQYGGSGRQFNWKKLEQYTLQKPFLLSGGIGPDDAVDVLKFEHPQLYGVDLNSKFEVAPAQKDSNLLSTFIQFLRLGR